MEDGKECGPSPGISCALVAEREDRGVYVAEFMRDPAARRRSENGGAAGDGGGVVPTEAVTAEDVGSRAMVNLFKQIQRGAVYSGAAQPLALMLDAFSREDMSRVRVGTLSRYSVAPLLAIREATGVEFKVRAEYREREDGDGGGTVLLSCLGLGYKNMARAST